MKTRFASVSPVLLRGDPTAYYLMIEALEGVIAPGRPVNVRIGDTWKRAIVAESWLHAGGGGTVCLDLVDPTVQA